MYNFKAVQEKLKIDVKVEYHRPQLHELGDFKGKFAQKLEWWLERKRKYIKSIRTEHLNYRGYYEVGNMTGIQLLSFLIDILDDTTLLNQSGDCILLSVQNHFCAAIITLQQWRVDMVTVPPEDKDDRFVYAKLFDDRKVKQMQKSRSFHMYRESDIQSLRSKAKMQFPNFLKQTVESFSLFYFRCAFMHLLCKIAISETKRSIIDWKENSPSPVPTAACIRLAFESNQTGKLTDVFGEHTTGSDVTANRKKFVGEYIRTKNQRPNRNDITENTLKYRIDCQMKAAKDIISCAISTEVENLWDKEVIDSEVQNIQKLYQANE